ncbi:MAG: exodeoxyribonuclease VII small subunit [Firmicutes bacterium]|nr:exodeoxyribonuclease VII small subunit [Candidatus Colivicinus equi]
MADNSFENKMKKLEEIVSKLEKDDIGLDKSISLYEEGLELSKSLKDDLTKFEKKIEEINSNEE